MQPNTFRPGLSYSMNSKTISLALALLLTACSPTNKTADAPNAQYELLTVELTDHSVNEEYAAQIRGVQDIRLIPRVEGYLQEIHVTEGCRVRKGQLLFVIDQTSYKAALRKAETSVAQAMALAEKVQLEYAGKEKLRERGVVSEYDLAQSRRDLHVANANQAAARAEEDAARCELSFTRICSPSDGIIGRLPYRCGDFVGPSAADGLTIVSDDSRCYACFSMTERQIMEYLSAYSTLQEAISHFPEVRLLLPDGTVCKEAGRVESISGIVDDQTGAVSVRAAFPQHSGGLLSGSTARILLPRCHKQAIVIPQEATFEVLDKVYVCKVVGGKAVHQIITVRRGP